MPDSTEDRRQRHYELLKKSAAALSAEQEAEANAEAPAERAAQTAQPDPTTSPSAESGQERRQGDRRQGDRRQPEPVTYMYRGREVKRGLSSAPGAGSNATRADWASRSDDNGDKTEAIKAALAKLSNLHAEGKVSDEEYEEKKQKLLSRL